MLPTDHGFPSMVKEWEHLFKATCKKGNNGTVCHVNGFVSQAQNTHTRQHTKAHQQTLKDWMYPVWLLSAVCKMAECPTPSVPDCLLPYLPNHPPLHPDSWQAHHELEAHLNLPKYRDTPAYWAEWIDQHPEHCLQGIKVKPDGLMSLHCIHDMLVIKKWNLPISSADRN